MRALFAVLALFMALFAAVQYNDPDGLAWAAIYGVPAIWATLAAARPQLLTLTMVRLLLGVSLIAGLALVVFLWPTAEAWWRIDVWWDSEASREGMGVMLATAVVLAVFAKSLISPGHAGRSPEAPTQP